MLLYVGQIFFGEWIEMWISFGNNRGRVWIGALCTSSSKTGSKLEGKLGTEGAVRLQCDLLLSPYYLSRPNGEAKIQFIFV